MSILKLPLFSNRPLAPFPISVMAFTLENFSSNRFWHALLAGKPLENLCFYQPNNARNKASLVRTQSLEQFKQYFKILHEQHVNF